MADVGFPVLLGVLGLVFFMGFALVQQANTRKVWAEAAQRLGLFHHKGALGGVGSIQGEHSGFLVRVKLTSRGSGKNSSTWTSYEVGPSSLRPALVSMGPEGFLSGLGKFLTGEGDVEIGDDDFDDAVKLDGPPILLSALLDGVTRDKVKWLVGDGDVRIKRGVITLEKSGQESDPNVIISEVETLVALAKRLTLEAGPPIETRLRRNVEGDRVPEVRRRSLKWLIERFPDHKLTRGALESGLEDADGHVRLTAIAAAGAAGEAALARMPEDRNLHEQDRLSALQIMKRQDSPQLEAVLDRLMDQLSELARMKPELACVLLDMHLKAPVDDRRRQQLLHALPQATQPALTHLVHHLGRLGERAAEPLFIKLLSRDHVELRIALAEALAEVGGRDAVAPLQPLTGGLLADARLKSAAKAAIEAIQGRLGPSARGGLSLTEKRQEGRLSMHRGGRLSEPGTGEAEGDA